MEAQAFCPAHVTGFFKAHLDDNQSNLENLGSMGAGFSIKQGVTTKVKINTKNNQESNFRIFSGLSVVASKRNCMLI